MYIHSHVMREQVTGFIPNTAIIPGPRYHKIADPITDYYRVSADLCHIDYISQAGNPSF